MADRRNAYDNKYINGNTVRKLEAAPDYTRERQRRQERKVQNVPVRKAQPVSLDFFSLLILVVAISVTVYAAIEYIQVQHESTQISKTLIATEKEFIDLKNENDAAYSKISTSIDLSKVYQVATMELGMVHANRSQVIPYESIKSDYVRQYGEIPKADKGNIIDKLIK
jgi:cell division protein FtsL